ncbi:hypothetical protein HY643_04385 [Candidatus Woesearchaeota archaeon]|nr:hypothetical protein [Candidatus Woesearchaeota archaeon]
MGLEKIFTKIENPFEEKKLEVVGSEEAVLDEWMAYFEQTNLNFNVYTDILDFYKNYLVNFEIKPAMIKKFNDMVDTKKFNDRKKMWLGLFLSAMIQTSYNKGFNDFVFEEINVDNFGMYLQGQKDKPIKIKAKIIDGNSTLNDAENCVAKITSYKGKCFGWYMKDCKIYSSNEAVLEQIRKQSWKQNNSFEIKK